MRSKRVKCASSLPRLHAIPALNRRIRTSTGSGADSVLSLYFLQQQEERLRIEQEQLREREGQLKQSMEANAEKLSETSQQIEAMLASNVALRTKMKEREMENKRAQAHGNIERTGARRKKEKLNTIPIGY